MLDSFFYIKKISLYILTEIIIYILLWFLYYLAKSWIDNLIKSANYEIYIYINLNS